MSDFNPNELNATLQRFATGTASDGDRQLIQQAILAERIVIASSARSVAIGGDMIDSVIVTGDVPGTLLIFKGGDAATIREALQTITTHLNPLTLAERDALRTAYLSEVISKYKFWSDHYTSLAAIAHLPVEPVSAPMITPREFLPRGFDALLKEESTPDSEIKEQFQTFYYDDVREAIAKLGSLVLLGEPGAGKTATLWRLMYDYAVKGPVDHATKIPILVSLGRYDGKSPVIDFLRSELLLASIEKTTDQAYPAHRRLALHLDEFLEDGQLAIFCDALNEMPQASYANSIHHIDEFRERQRGNQFVFTCRTPEYTVRFDLPEVTIQDLDETQQHDFLVMYLSDTAGRLLEALRDQSQPLLGIAGNPYTLLMIGQVYQLRSELPSNRGQLFQSFVTALMERERSTHAARWLAAEIQILALSELAFAIQREHGRGTSVPSEWIEKYLTGHVRLNDQDVSYIRADLIYLAQSASFLDIASDGSLRFTHQLLQEYFAAVALLRFGLSDAQFLEATRYYSWDEVMILLSGLMEDATPVIELLAQVDPFLASRCAGAAQTISEKAHEMLARQLVQKMNSPYESEQLRALEAMGNLKSAWVVQYLLDALRGASASEATIGEWNRRDARRSTIVKALSRMKYSQVSHKIPSLLSDNQWVVRMSAVEILGQQKSAMTIPLLVPMLNDREANVRTATVRALRNIADEGVIPHLLPLLKDSNWEVRMTVVHGLARFRSEIVIPQLITLLRHRDSELQQSSAWALGELKVESAIPDLILLLKNSKEEIRAAAASALGAFSPSTVLPQLTPLLKDKDPKILQGTAWALRLLKTETAVRPLILLLKDKHPEVREAAATSLREFKAETAIPHLVLLLKDKDNHVRMSAEATLVQFDPAIIAPQLLPLLADTDAAVRQVAVMALGDIKAKTAIPNLLPLLEDKDSRVRAAAIVALRELEAVEAIPGLEAMVDEKSALGRLSADALGAIPSCQSISQLLPLLKNADPQIRVTAVRALARLEPEEVSSHLLALLKDDSQFVREAAIKLLGLLKVDAAIPQLLLFLNDNSPRIRSEVVETLKASVNESQLPLIRPYLDVADSFVHSAAFEITETVKRRLNLPKDYQIATQAC